MTSRSDLTTHQIDKPLFAASYPGVCLRYIRRHRDPVRPSCLLQVQHINDAKNSIDGLVTPNDEKLAADLSAMRFRSPLRTAGTHFPHEFRGFATQSVKFHLFADPRD
jgi:hypothetical protein